jgi:predicted oxidoreductase
VTPVRVDLVVVGAGAAGLSATIEAAARGLTVAVVEQGSAVGGTAATAAGGTLFAGSPVQAALGVADDPDKALADWVAWGGPSADREWAGRYVAASVSELFDWWSGLGVQWRDTLISQEGNSVPRWHTPRGGGRAVMGALERAARRHATVSCALDTRVTGIDTAGGRVTGVAARGPAGDVEYRAPAVLLACGGFGSDPELLASALPAPPPRILLGGGRGARGDGHRMLAALGAEFVNLDAVWMYPFATPDPADEAAAGAAGRGLVVRGLDGDIWVNVDGMRFHDESSRGGASGAPALLAQPGATCWSVLDRRIAERFTVSDPAYRSGLTPDRAALAALLATSPYIAQADDVGRLADRAGIDAGGLLETVAAHNRRVVGGAGGDPFGRDLAGLAPLAVPPFYAIRFFPLARKNLGGVRTTLDCEVVGGGGVPIPGLLAAGELAGMAGGCINGRAALEGTMLGPSSYSGRVAGRRVLA